MDLKLLKVRLWHCMRFLKIVNAVMCDFMKVLTVSVEYVESQNKRVGIKPSALLPPTSLSWLRSQCLVKTKIEHQ